MSNANSTALRTGGSWLRTTEEWMPLAPRRRPRAWAAAALCAAALLQGPVSTQAGAASSRVRQKAQPRQILILSANLAEVWDAHDNARAGDLSTFARRVRALAPHAPDVVLLQEVSWRSTKRVVRRLNAKTSGRYAIAISPGNTPFRYRHGRLIKTDTSILFNKRTMRHIGRARLIATTYARRHGARGRPHEVKRNSSALLRERRTGVTFPIANIHFHPGVHLRNDKVSYRYRTVWVRKVVRALQRRWPRYAARAVMGGDFNARRLRSTSRGKEVMKWWRVMYRRGFRDAVHEVRSHVGIDYIFTRTRIAGAQVDLEYDPSKARGSSYYSDHRMRWALLGRWRADLDSAEALSSTRARLEWRRLPSVRKYRIDIRRRGARWQVAGWAPGRSMVSRDGGLAPLTTYEYRVVAWNGAETSIPSRVRRIRTPQDVAGPRRPEAPRLRLQVTTRAARIGWHPTRDRGGSGTAGYEVWRDPWDGDPEMLGRTAETTYVDQEFLERPRVDYFIVAYDHVGNRSRRSEPASVVRRN